MDPEEKKIINSNNRIEYFCQIIVCFIILITCIICICLNINLNNDKNNFFVALLCSIIGYILPNPSIKKIKSLKKFNSLNQDEVDNDHVSINSNVWTLFGRKIPKSEIVFFSQVIISYIIIIISLLCLVIGDPSPNDYLFTILTTTSLGYLLPNPKLKKKYGIYRNSSQ